MSKFHNFTRLPLGTAKPRAPYLNCIAQYLATYNHCKFLTNYYISAELRIGSRETQLSRFDYNTVKRLQ